MSQELRIIRGTNSEQRADDVNMSVMIGVAPGAVGMSRLCDQLQAQAFLPDRLTLKTCLGEASGSIVLILPAHEPVLLFLAARHPKVHRLVAFFSGSISIPAWKKPLIRAGFALADQTLVWTDEEITEAVKQGADPDRVGVCHEQIAKNILDETPRRAMKEAIASLVLDAAEATGGIRFLESFSPDRGANVVNYHRVLPPEEHRQYPRPQQAIAAPLFEVQLEQMAQRKGFTPIEAIRERNSHGRVGITFDDGYEDNHRVALDSLQRWSVPACIYIVTGQVDETSSLWWDYIGDALFILWREESPLLKEPGLPQGSEALLKIRSTLQARDHISMILGDLNSALMDERIRIQKLLKKLTHFEGRRTMLTWEQIRAMDAAGISFGSHTQNHVCLDELSEEEAQREVVGGQSDLEQALGKKAKKSVALPRGKLGPFTEESLREAGFASVMTTIAGVNRANDDSLFVLRRDGKMLSLRGRHHPAKMRLELSGWMDRLRNLRPSTNS